MCEARNHYIWCYIRFCMQAVLAPQLGPSTQQLRQFLRVASHARQIAKYADWYFAFVEPQAFGCSLPPTRNREVRPFRLTERSLDSFHDAIAGKKLDHLIPQIVD